MKKLFAVRNGSTKRLVPDKFFDKKKDAKIMRDELNESETKGSVQYTVTLGPDHRRY